MVLAVATTHEVEELKTAGEYWVVKGLRDVRLTGVDGSTRNLKIEISNTFNNDLVYLL